MVKNRGGENGKIFPGGENGIHQGIQLTESLSPDCVRYAWNHHIKDDQNDMDCIDSNVVSIELYDECVNLSKLIWYQ